MTKIEDRLKSLENVNDLAAVKAQDERIITTKEIYERLIVLETKIQAIDKDNQRVENKFTIGVIVVVILEIIGILVNLSLRSEGL